MSHQRFQNEPVITDPGVEEDSPETVTYEVANMAEEENTFHLTYEDGKTVSFQVYDENIAESTPAMGTEPDNKT